MKGMKEERIVPKLEDLVTSPEYLNIAWDAINGEFWRIKKGKVRNKVFPDQSNLFWCVVDGVVQGKDKPFLTHRKGEVIAWNLLHGEIPEGMQVIAFGNYKKESLVLVSTLQLKAYHDALANLAGFIRISKYGYVRVYYKLHGKECQAKFLTFEKAEEFKQLVLAANRKVVEGFKKLDSKSNY